MGKKGKTGKSRKDKFYHLAKETGFRSRASFKLIQLNRKYEFLQTSNVIIDLCAAPGGWLQVASQNAPMSNHIIGIDLVPITPIRNVKTFQEDITTEKCRQTLRKELHTVKADLVLNDGAPNLGKNWLHDAFSQAELTLHAMKLATEFLRKGGWFVTKLFRSKDYNSLMWVFQQLFKSVHATKPQASRNESAEIFVVCQGFLAPDKIDTKFTDPKHVFQDVESAKRQIDLIHPEKKRRQREGYPEGDYTLFHTLTLSEFLASEDYMTSLAESSEITIDIEEISNHPLTTPEIKECIKDIKVLGKREIKLVFAWRNKLKKEIEAKEAEANKEDAGEEEEAESKEKTEEEIEEEEMAEIDKLLEERNLQELKAMKKAKKKVHKAQMKQKVRIDLQMAIPGDKLDLAQDPNIFDIKQIRNKRQLAEVEKGDLSHLDGDDIFEESDDEDLLPRKIPREYFERGTKRYVGVEEETDEEEAMEEEPDFSDEEENEDESEDEKEQESKSDSNPLVVDLGFKESLVKSQQASWFMKSAFADLEKGEDEDVELSQLAGDGDKTQLKMSKASLKKAKATKVKTTKAAKKIDTEDGSDDESADAEFVSKRLNGNMDADDSGLENEAADDSNTSNAEESDDDDSDSDSGSDYDFGNMTSKRKRKPDKRQPKKIDGIEVVPESTEADKDLQLDAEGLAIGTAMIESKKRKREIVDSSYHRYMFDDKGLPNWFLTDEKRHMKIVAPVSKEEIEEYKIKMKAVDAQPIKKIAEAKARKKRKMLKRQEKARKKANAITDDINVSDKEKWQQIKQIYKKAGLLKNTKPSITYVVTKKGAGKKVRRPAGVKGQFKVVDPRLKKDMNAQKKAAAKKTGKGKKQHGGRGIRVRR